MALSLNYQKKLEAEIHEQLYSNIFILTLSYPTTKLFNAQFKQDMFVKSNKTAFQHMIHFLLNILDPHIFEKKIITWPIYDIKQESHFRNDLMKYLNELNSCNKETGIPLLMTSHLLSPGGFKFAHFMYRLSQYVLAEHIRRNNKSANIMLPLKANVDYEISSEQLRILNQLVDDQYNTLTQKQTEFQAKLDYAKNRSKNIVEEKIKCDQIIKNSEQKINDFLISNENKISVTDKVPDRESETEKMFQQLDQYKQLLQKCSELTDILSDNRNVVKLERDYYNVAETVVENYKQKNNKDLVEHFQMLLKVLENNQFLLRTRKDPKFEEYLQTTADIYDDLKEYTNKYAELLSEFHLFKGEMDTGCGNNSIVSEKVREIFEVIPAINIYMNN